MRITESQVVESMLGAYRSGLFPMAEPISGQIEWYCPDPRAIVPLDEPGGARTWADRLSRSLRARVRSGRFVITGDRAFREVIRGCAEPRRSDLGFPSWIDDRIMAVYVALHRAGHAHSIEAWLLPDEGRGLVVDSAPAVPLPGGQAGGSRRSGRARPPQPAGVLVGGLYGVHIGAAFFGESMFCRPDLGGTDASKVCFAHLLAHLHARGFELLDSQMANPHMTSLGIVEIARAQYLSRLKKAVGRVVTWGEFDPAEAMRAVQARTGSSAPARPAPAGPAPAPAVHAPAVPASAEPTPSVPAPAEPAPAGPAEASRTVASPRVPAPPSTIPRRRQRGGDA